MKIVLVVGARPNFMKVAPIISAIKRHNSTSKQHIQSILVHTGQHYDKMMSDAFFTDLDLPKPDIFLGVGSASQAVQTAEIMKQFEQVVIKEKPDLVMVAGDVNSTVACALVASKISYDSNGKRPLIAHVEAGLRSLDRTMPEEINRILTDHISDFLFITEESGIKNLKKEGISEDKIFFVGNTMIDTLYAFRNVADKSQILRRLGLKNNTHNKNSKKQNSVVSYALLTLHRPSNVDNDHVFSNIIHAMKEVGKDLRILFPAHPRTQNRIKEFGLQYHFEYIDTDRHNKNKNIILSDNKINLISPLGYIDFLCLMKNAKMVLTDSGGIQEETTCLGIPCVTLRENTERPVTITQGTNVLAGIDKDQIIKTSNEQLQKKFKKNIPKFWDGKAAERIIKIISKVK